MWRIVLSLCVLGPQGVCESHSYLGRVVLPGGYASEMLCENARHDAQVQRAAKAALTALARHMHVRAINARPVCTDALEAVA